MTGSPPRWSLGGRLSRWFALTTFVGLAAVCAAVYLEAEAHLRDRQSDLLNQYQQTLRYLASESGENWDMFIHKLDDLVRGRTDVSLELLSSDGKQLYHVGTTSVFTLNRRFRLENVGPSIRYVEAMISLDVAPDQRLLDHLIVVLTLGALVGTASISAIGYALVKKGLAPVGGLGRQISQLTASKLDDGMDGSNQPTELQPLVEQFNELLLRLRAAYEQLKGFNADVAHELRTPLTLMAANSQLILRGAHSTEEFRDAIESNLEDLNRLSSIIGDMLFLAQADRGVRARRIWVESLHGLCQTVADYHVEAYEDERRRIYVTGDAAGHYDASLLKRALSNLVENALRYSKPNSPIEISISRQAAGVDVCVQSLGETLTQDVLTHMFERFYRASDDVGANRHHGLGLSIVAAIAAMHSGKTIATSEHCITRIGFFIQDARPDGIS